jgi:hypothetical protein
MGNAIPDAGKPPSKIGNAIPDDRRPLSETGNAPDAPPLPCFPSPAGRKRPASGGEAGLVRFRLAVTRDLRRGGGGARQACPRRRAARWTARGQNSA